MYYLALASFNFAHVASKSLKFSILSYGAPVKSHNAWTGSPPTISQYEPYALA